MITDSFSIRDERNQRPTGFNALNDTSSGILDISSAIQEILNVLHKTFNTICYITDIIHDASLMCMIFWILSFLHFFFSFLLHIKIQFSVFTQVFRFYFTRSRGTDYNFKAEQDAIFKNYTRYSSAVQGCHRSTKLIKFLEQ